MPVPHNKQKHNFEQTVFYTQKCTDVVNKHDLSLQSPLHIRLLMGSEVHNTDFNFFYSF